MSLYTVVRNYFRNSRRSNPNKTYVLGFDEVVLAKSSPFLSAVSNTIIHITGKLSDRVGEVLPISYLKRWGKKKIQARTKLEHGGTVIRNSTRWRRVARADDYCWSLRRHFTADGSLRSFFLLTADQCLCWVNR